MTDQTEVRAATIQALRLALGVALYERDRRQALSEMPGGVVHHASGFAAAQAIVEGLAALMDAA